VIYLGVDPDLHATAIASLEDHPSPEFKTDAGALCLWVLTTPSKLTGYDAARAMVLALTQWEEGTHYSMIAAVEAQYFAPHSKSRPNDIAILSFVAGGACARLAQDCEVLTPLPVQWKGNTPKPVHHHRIAERLGWSMTTEKGYGIPQGAPGLLLDNPAHWKHAMDAIGLALWAKDQHETQAALTTARKRAKV
jgi:hypothetical protein